ncbi:MAG: pseudouridine-5'-phosphate glycosidase [Bacilli bacterium]|jgi:pseudouridine-5'-phosphate glycosidase
MTKYLSINLEVSEALKNKTPIVALESTIISHGMPYPQNVQTALQSQQIIREHGATPATIAIINGFLKIGLTEKEIDYLGRKGTDVLKTSSRDIPYIVSKKLDGATTVSATAFIASLAGIRVFATGGIGGVHRGAETSFDISADLEELAKTNVAVVCAGAKSILDLGLTLEYLETKAIEVIGYQTDFLPAFYTSKSEFKVNHRLDSALEIAQLMQAKWEMGLRGGIIVANPIPKEYEVDPIIIDKAIEIAIKEMNELHITGNKTTPYLLAKIKEITGGASLDANIQLVYNNCKLASNIAQNLY